MNLTATIAATAQLLKQHLQSELKRTTSRQ